MPDIPGNYLLIISVVVGSLVVFFPQLKPIWEKIKPYLPTKSTNSPQEKSGLDQYSVHELIEHLIAKAKKEKDEEGLVLIGTYGKHVYDLKIGGK